MNGDGVHRRKRAVVEKEMYHRDVRERDEREREVRERARKRERERERGQRRQRSKIQDRCAAPEGTARARRLNNHRRSIT
jgi:hypothetical protein